ncbi:MAG: hypothetical protein ACJAQ6_000569 [Arenicella sp.]|jgi:hypothetical protein
MLDKRPQGAGLFFIGLLLLLPNNSSAEAAPSVSPDHSCQMHLVYRSAEQEQNQLLQQQYKAGKWTDPILVHSNPTGLSYGATMASDIDGNILLVWVENNGGVSQLMYRVKSDSGDWLSGPRQFTASKGEKTTPLLMRSISGEIYLLWVSDENASDDVFLVNWSLAEGWSDTQLLSANNAFPDIRPRFDYVQDIEGSYNLVARWQARSEDGIYASDQLIIETDLELTSAQLTSIDNCSKELASVALPLAIQSGFVHLPQLGLDSYQRIN